MTHCTRTSYNPASGFQSRISRPVEISREDCEPKQVKMVYHTAQTDGVLVTEARRDEIRKETLEINSRSLTDIRSDWRPFSDQPGDISEHRTTTVATSGPRVPQGWGNWGKLCRPLELEKLPVSRPFQDDLTGLTSDFPPWRFITAGTQSCIHRMEKTQLSSREFTNAKSRGKKSTVCVHDTSRESRLTSRKRKILYSGEENRVLQGESNDEKLPSTLKASEVGGPSSPKELSRTSNHLLCSKKSGANLSKGGQMVNDSTGFPKLGGNAFYEFLTLPHDGRKLQLRHLGKSTSIEGNEDDKAAKTGSLHIKSESSAETEAMETKLYQPKNFTMSLAPSTSHQDVKVSENPAESQVTITSSKKRKVRSMTERHVPGVNHELPSILLAVETTDKVDPSTSRTESLNENSVSWGKQNNSIDQARWFKPIKINSPKSSVKKVDNLFRRIMSYSKSGSIQPSEETKLEDSSSMESVNKLSWIQRWCRNPKPILQVKSKEKQFQRKQSPSISAMVLMGKAMNGLEPCELRDKGSLVVWNADRF
ncbi:hypothetical protein GIB67_005537 [Kingdonia uniflora]|uniref:Uncharacterized protein n=1 Tax=Kingdonia uniflora TaxID=39325 RepID=A0A7J7NHL0_9MAGN|nr:hypothetical protein GIB67_005537 [Kingdonia uniflora]